ncbi:zonadhesin-like [Ranitomeya imitator]|uniref:zonadhesin-like n=1 Tax=Ranitomeya imitator TaxID=111125 RepID=UPI001AAA747D
MASKNLLGLMVAVCFLCLIERNTATSIRCPRNSIYECKPLCYNTCDNLNATSCKKSCTTQCHCIEGYVYDSENYDNCVPISSCKVNCPPYMTFVECTKTPQETCETLGIKYQEGEKCMPRCVCIPDYVLSNEIEPRCVKKTKCPQITFQ